MTKGIQKPNCGNCTKEHTYECPIDLHKSHGNSDIFDGIRRVTSNCPMACHPNAREYLNAGVIQELERRSNADRTAHASSNVRKGTLEECISLLKGGKV